MKKPSDKQYVPWAQAKKQFRYFVSDGPLVAYYKPGALSPQAVIDLRQVSSLTLGRLLDPSAPATSVHLKVKKHNITVDFATAEDQSDWLRLWACAVPLGSIHQDLLQHRQDMSLRNEIRLRAESVTNQRSSVKGNAEDWQPPTEPLVDKTFDEAIVQKGAQHVENEKVVDPAGVDDTTIVETSSGKNVLDMRESPPSAIHAGQTDLLPRYAKYNLHSVAASSPYGLCKLGAEGIVEDILILMQNERMRVHLESVLCVLAACMGYACQVSVRRLNMMAKKNQDNGYHTFRTDSGEFFFGPAIDHQFSDRQGVLSIIREQLSSIDHDAENKELDSVFSRIKALVGTRLFGKFLPEHIRGPTKLFSPPHDSPLNWLCCMWPTLFHRHVLPLCSTPREWPFSFAFALVQILKIAQRSPPKQRMSDVAAFTLIIESAVPMSSINLIGWDDVDCSQLVPSTRTRFSFRNPLQSLRERVNMDREPKQGIFHTCFSSFGRCVNGIVDSI